MRKLLFFHAPWCPPCRFYEREFISPLEEIVGTEKIQRINTQEDPFTAEKYMVDRLPVAVLIENDVMIMKYTGAIDIEDIAGKLQNKYD